MKGIPRLVVTVGLLGCVGGESSERADSIGTPPARSAAPSVAVVREESAVRVGAAVERWSLRWRRAPISACGPEQIEAASTCPCIGFAYGEMGELDLVRRREGHPDERFALTPLFQEGENPGTEDQSHRAVLQRWPTLEADFDRSESTDLAPIIRTRAPARVMLTGDYNHDGAASEFLLQVGTSPCGKREAVLIGVSRADSSLHAFSSVAHPERPLVLEINFWEQLRRSRGKITGVEWPCGDHASETETVVQLWVDERGLNGERIQYECMAGRGRGRVVSSERI